MAELTAEQEARRLRAIAAVALVVASASVGFMLGRTSAWVIPFDSRVKVAPGPAVAARPGDEPNSAAATDLTKVPAARAGTSEASRRSEQSGATSEPPKPLPSASAAANDQRSAKQARSPAVSSASTTPSAPADRETSASALQSSSEASAARAAPEPQSAASTPVRESSAATGSATGDESGTAEPPPPANVKMINPGAAEARRPAGKAKPDGQSVDTKTTAADPGVAECERRYSSFRRSDGTYQPFGGGARTRCPHLR